MAGLTFFNRTMIEMDGHQVHNASSDNSSNQFNGNVGGQDVAPGKHLINSPKALGDSLQVNGNVSEAAFAALVQSRAQLLEAKGEKPRFGGLISRKKK